MTLSKQKEQIKHLVQELSILKKSCRRERGKRMKDNHTWVICAYGKSDYLEACIQSLKNQTLQSQIICYSSTPLDSIKDLCQRYAIPFYTKQGGGIGKDWNNAISFVETKYATIAHQDDYYEPSYAEKVLSKMEKTSDVLIGYSDYFEEKMVLRSCKYKPQD